MIQASAAFMAKVNNGDIPFVRMQLITSDGKTMWIEDGQFWSDGLAFNESTSQEGVFTVGSAVIGSFRFSLANFDRAFDSLQFAGSVVIPFVYYDIDGEKEYLAKGVYYIASHTTSGNIIHCVALDGMKLLDTSSSTVTYPITVNNLVRQICTKYNFTLDTDPIPNGDMVLNAPSGNQSGDVVTDRQLLSYACQLSGNFAKMNENGNLEVKWYDFDDPIVVNSTFDGKSLWTSQIGVTGLRIIMGGSAEAYMGVSIDPNGNLIYMRTTGIPDTFAINENGDMISYSSSGATYSLQNGSLIRVGEELVPSTDEGVANEEINLLYGTDEYVIKIENNPYVTLGNLSQVCTVISNKIFGKTMRPGTLPILSNPCLQAGDVLEITDHITKRKYHFPITSLTYTKSLTENIVCSFESREDADIRPSSDYRMSISVRDALKQAEEADAIARYAAEMAEQNGYQCVVTSDKGIAIYEDTVATLTATVYDNEMNEYDPDGTELIYRWWATSDGESSAYLGGGKEITVNVNDSFCDFAAGIYFETIATEKGIYPFVLCNRNGVLLTNRAGTLLTARAATRYQ